MNTNILRRVTQWMLTASNIQVKQLILRGNFSIEHGSAITHGNTCNTSVQSSWPPMLIYRPPCHLNAHISFGRSVGSLWSQWVREHITSTVSVEVLCACVGVCDIRYHGSMYVREGVNKCWCWFSTIIKVGSLQKSWIFCWFTSSVCLLVLLVVCVCECVWV